jgi:hypothetical protein
MKHSSTITTAHQRNRLNSSGQTTPRQRFEPMPPRQRQRSLMSPFEDFSRVQLHARIEVALSHFIPSASPEIAGNIAADLAASISEVAAQAYELGVRSATGPETAGIIIGSIFNQHSVPNTKLTHGKTRAAASKAICRARRMLGLLPETWQNARAGRITANN